MEKIDPAMAERVWKRVTAPAAPFVPTPPPAGGIGEQLTDTRQLQQVYLHLARKATGRKRMFLQQLALKKQEQLQCLQGLCALEGGCSEPQRLMRWTDLRQCYQQETALLRQYRAREADPAHGHVFSHLARQQQEICVQLLQWLGKER